MAHLVYKVHKVNADCKAYLDRMEQMVLMVYLVYKVHKVNADYKVSKD